MPTITARCVVCKHKFSYEYKGGNKRVTCDKPGSVGGCWDRHHKELMRTYRARHLKKVRALVDKHNKLRLEKAKAAKAEKAREIPLGLRKTNHLYPKAAFVNPHHRAPGLRVRTITIRL